MPHWHKPAMRPYPLQLRPELVPKVWGGRRLAEMYGRRSEEPIGEAWLLSDHPKAPTYVANGPLAGRTLGDALTELNGSRTDAGGGRFPLLVKLIESCEPLSVQVHPDDRVARELETEPWGKNEAWYVLDSEQGYVGLGFNCRVEEASVGFLRSAPLPELMHRVPVRKQDLIYVPSGEIHYIGPGVLLLEVQQSSDLTYRIYDWGREGRELHLEKAARALRWEPRDPEELLRRGSENRGFGGRWPFELEWLELTESSVLGAEAGPRILLPLSGRGTLEHETQSWALEAFQCWLLPERTEATLRVAEPLRALLCRPRAGDRDTPQTR